MLNTLENTINMYNSIFVDKSTDFRLESCELKDFTLNCMALDEIELSVACIVNMPNIANSRYKEMDVIEWKYIKKDCSFYFYPTIPEVKIDELMQELSIGKCKQYSYGTESIMLPVFDQEYRSNKVKLKSYSMRVGQIDKDNLDFQKLA